jgi:hypothetical protein
MFAVAILKLAYPLGFEPSLTVLETDVLPLTLGIHVWCARMESNHHPKVRSLVYYPLYYGRIKLVAPPGNDPRTAGYQPTVIPFNYRAIFGVPYRYRSGTTAFTEQGAGHYTKDTI